MKTSLVEPHAEGSGNSPKAKMQIWIHKTPDFDKLVTTASFQTRNIRNYNGRSRGGYRYYHKGGNSNARGGSRAGNNGARYEGNGASAGNRISDTAEDGDDDDVFDIVGRSNVNCEDVELEGDIVEGEMDEGEFDGEYDDEEEGVEVQDEDVVDAVNEDGATTFVGGANGTHNATPALDSEPKSN